MRGEGGEKQVTFPTLLSLVVGGIITTTTITTTNFTDMQFSIPF